MLYAITDIETTGGSISTTKITEIAIYIHDGTKIINSYSSLVNPEREIPPFISRLTGITNEMVSDAPKFYEIAKEILLFIEDAIFVAHNVGFDYNVLRQEYKSLGYEFRKDHLCTVRSARYTIPGHTSYSLGKLTKSLDIPLFGRHRASGDALATAHLFTLLYKKSENQLANFIQKEINPKKLHPNLDISKIELLPSGTGVYFFHNEDNEIIYIGKSKNIKTRVKQHLKNNTSVRSINLQNEITNVSYYLTGNELIALLKESEEIKKHLPKFNRQLRKERSSYGLYSYTDGKGYLNLIVDKISNKSSTPITLFENKRDANSFLDKLCEKHQLCSKLVGRSKGDGSCFGYQIKQCKGACIGDESQQNYNHRLEKILEKLNYFLASFYIIENGRNKNEIGIIAIENGRYIGYGFVFNPSKNTSVDKWRRLIVDKIENKDAKQIIQSYLNKKTTPKIRQF